MGLSDSIKEQVRTELAILRDENMMMRGLLKHAICPNCDGSGIIPYQISGKQYVTRDMAIDAGDPTLEGSLFSDDQWEAEQCQWCYERNVVLGE
jgi:hypothetical protein